MQHHELSPSSFPAWAICPAFDSDNAEREDANEGTRQHEALSRLLRAPADADPAAVLAPLSEQAADAVAWAARYVRALAGGLTVLSEHHLTYTTPDAFALGGRSVVYFGTGDAIIIHPPGSTADLIDYKSGADGDHRAQLAGYALALFSMRPRLKTIRCHVCYGRSRTADAWALTQADAAGVVLPILEARGDPSKHVPTACAHCGYCAHRATCTALTSQVAVVAESAPTWGELAPAIRDPAALSDPATAAKALTVARYVQTWADAIRARCTEMAKEGATLPGYRLQERKAPREVSDLPAALALSGLEVPAFFSACKVSLPKLGEAYAKARGVPKAAAAREVEAMLAGIIVEGTPSFSLVQSKE